LDFHCTKLFEKCIWDLFKSGWSRHTEMMVTKVEICVHRSLETRGMTYHAGYHGKAPRGQKEDQAECGP
jgi:hypothetical protein